MDNFPDTSSLQAPIDLTSSQFPLLPPPTHPPLQGDFIPVIFSNVFAVTILTFFLLPPRCASIFMSQACFQVTVLDD